MESDDEETEIVNPGIAPEVISYRDIDSQMGEFTRKVELNERILHRLQQYELMLLDASNLPALLDVLIWDTAEHFSLPGVSLRLYDADGALAELMAPAELNYGDALTLVRDMFDMQQLYGVQPIVEEITAQDPRAIEQHLLSEAAETMVLLPLIRDGELIGSFHWGVAQAGTFANDVEMDFINHLAAIIAICLENCANAERLSRLSLLDPLTRLSNDRALGMELRKEISRAQRAQKPLSVLLIEIDGFKDIAENYGHLAGDFTLKAVARNIATSLRRTDHLARCNTARFALLLPACPETKAHEIAERMRSDTEFMEIDDGRGANLFTSLSIGLVSWNPKNYPAINMEQLAGQIESSARSGLLRGQTNGGNRVAVARLTGMLV